MFVFLTIASFAAVLVQQQAWFAIDPGILGVYIYRLDQHLLICCIVEVLTHLVVLLISGLAISMLIQLSGLFQWCVRQSAEVVNMMVAVERVVSYRDLPSEASLNNEYDKKVQQDWPEVGGIDVKDLSVRYRSGLPLSLRGLTFKVNGGSRVGIVGRTG